MPRNTPRTLQVILVRAGSCLSHVLRLDVLHAIEHGRGPEVSDGIPERDDDFTSLGLGVRG